MDIRMSLAIMAGKLTRFAIKLLGRNASSFPGGVALKICPDLLRRMTMPKKMVAVTGSNGKTTTTQMIYTAAKQAGLDVICNTEGSNQIQGVTAMFLSHCTMGGKVKADMALIESDERFCQYTFSQITPDYILITNLYRDQMTRNGHSEFVRKELAKGLPEKSILIVNADEPVSASLAVNRKAIRYGLSVFSESENESHAYHDGAYCPVCYEPMTYDGRIISHVGNYSCTNCGFKRGTVDHEITAFDNGAFVIDGQYAVTPQMSGSNFAYNIIAAYTVLTEAFGLEADKAAQALDHFVIRGDRLHEFTLNGHRGLFILTKHENSMAYNAALSELAQAEESTLLVIVDQLSRKYSANDMSWLWDIDFHLAAADSVKKVVVAGQFAYDVAVRMQFAGVNSDRLLIVEDLDELMPKLKEQAIGDIYVMTCFTDVPKFTSRLSKEVQA